MMGKNLFVILAAFAAFALSSCTGSIEVEGSIDSLPPIFPDYTGVTVPENIAPLNFRVDDSVEADDFAVSLTAGEKTVLLRGREFDIPVADWKDLTGSGEDISAIVMVKDGGKWKAYNPFKIAVSRDRISDHLAYRLIEPGYVSWHKLGLFQRDLESFSSSAIITNESTDHNCMNCHSFAARNPSRMVFHMRAENGGTYLWYDGRLEKLNTKTPETISALVYPYWHPDGKLVAFSVNDTKQAFHSTDPNRCEVYDNASDIVVYDVARHEIVSAPFLMQPDVFETYPSFSSDGKTLYFCSAPGKDMPDEYKEVRYSICSVDFDPATLTFGSTVDTLYNSRETGRSAVFPRVSPDGNFLMFTETAYGCFPIWHKDADLGMIDLRSGGRIDLSAANSPDVDSYHSWSSDSRWVAFSSRRIDGLYTRPFICHISEDGVPSKPFLLPQKDTRFYGRFMKSFNIPELIDGPVTASPEEITAFAKSDHGVDITFKKNQQL